MIEMGFSSNETTHFMRVTTDFWASAYLRRCNSAGVSAVLFRRGALQAGAVLVRLDRLDGRVTLFGPAPHSEPDSLGERRFIRLHQSESINYGEAQERLQRQIAFDPDLWIIDIEDREGRHFLPLVEQL